ncbi:MAG TPA: hypothetical protein VM935_00200, partial [Chitinophagaceae bacterium]|nr:hypothetical protein [Chitinophagaceae bacterium]
MLTAILLLGGRKTPGAQNFVGFAFQSLVQHNPHRKFLLIHDEPDAASLLDFPNVERIRLNLNRRSVLYGWLLNRKITSILIEKGVSIFFTMRPFSNIRIPQYYLHTGATGKKALKDLQKLNGIIVASNAASTAMVSIGIDVARIAVVYGGSSVDAGSQSNGNESHTREEYTDGKQYFLFEEGPEENLMFLLKAFSKF